MTDEAGVTGAAGMDENGATGATDPEADTGAAARPGSIRTEPNGPYVVTGPLVIVDVDGREVVVPAGHTVKLCRCGHSDKKPYCDQSHRRVDFVSRPSFVPEPVLQKEDGK